MSADAARHRLTVPSGNGDATTGSSLTAATTSLRKTMAGGTTSSGGGASGSSSASSSLAAAAAGAGSTSSQIQQYLSRLVDFRQMDVQSALDQMKTLLSTRPHVVYKTAYYRKQTKNHWARDDPAFVALQLVFLVISCVAYSISFRVPLTGGLAFMLYSIVFNWLGSGLILATVCREVANRHLTDHKSSSHVRQSVEWLYAFDIHCNAFFPVFVLLYAVQFFLLPLVLGKSLFALVVSNTLYGAAFSWYWYITHLGYRTLPFLSQTEVFLFPVAAIALVYVLNLVGHPFGLGWNASRIMAHIYFD
mmetsp:Transcript_37111/g.89952  ORF Transcript_37111/g.89952 Transcript_37111/m.89952 type:complete len:305 (+) Transcript_37111:515-1429(+)